jgi:hydrogenase maturation protein HypF
MGLEFALDKVPTDEAYCCGVTGAVEPLVMDWASVLQGVLADVAGGEPAGLISARFHNALAELIVALARRFGLERVALSGGCFQNQYLTERAIARLREEGFRPYWHQRVPPNDGGIALGQVAMAVRGMRVADVSGCSREDH